MEGRVLGRYRLLEEIGQGGMSVVYRGVDTTLDREVAVKILHPHLSRKESSRTRFAREAKAVARLHHDNILEIYDFSGAEANEAYIVTELVRGETLEDFLDREGPVLCEVGVMIAAEIADAVAHAHDNKVIHRDLKTENVMIREDGVIKLMDFGIARLKEEVAATLTGLRMGTPHYMSPEQAAGTTDIDERADVFALGVLLFRLTTGELPFEGPNPAVILGRIIEGNYAPPDSLNPAVGRKLERVIKRSLSTQRDQRYENAAAFREALNDVMAESGLETPRSELARFFRDPSAYRDQLTDNLVVRYRRTGDDAVAKGSIPKALEMFNRVLVLDPDNVEVSQALERLGRRRRWGLVGSVTAATVIVLGGGAWAVQEFWPEASPTATATVAAGTSAVASETPTGSELSIASVTPSEARTATKAPTKTQVVATTAVAVASQTPVPEATLDPAMGHIRLILSEYAEVFIDGEKVGSTFQVRNQALPVAPGPHILKLVGTVCPPLTMPIDIAAGETIRGPKYLPGCKTWITVVAERGTDLTGATVSLDGEPVGTMPMAAPVATRSGNALLRVSKPGFEDYTDQVEIPTRQKDRPLRFIVGELKPLPEGG